MDQQTPEHRVLESRAKKISSVQKSRIAKAVIETGRRYEIPTDLLLAVIETESAYVSNRVSRARCVGLMQINPDTAPQIAKMIGMKRYNIERVEHNVELGGAYLRFLLDKYNRTSWALSAYNRGPGMFERQGHPVGRYSRLVIGKRPALRKILRMSVSS